MVVFWLMWGTKVAFLEYGQYAVCCKHKYPEIFADSNKTESMLADVRSYPLGFTCVLRRLSAMIVPATNGSILSVMKT